MLTKTLKRVKLKGKSSPVIREQYIRDDISCQSLLCKDCVIINKGIKTLSLPKDVTHYAIPCLDIISKYMEILELPELKGFIILQTIATKVMQNAGQRHANRLRNSIKDLRKASVVFLNEICRKSHVDRSLSETYDEWLTRSCVRCAEFYDSHLNSQIPIILITENTEDYKPLMKSNNVKVYPLGDYLKCFYADLESALQLYESLTLALLAGSVQDLSRSYDAYLPTNLLEAGIKAGHYHRGFLRVNKHNSSEEAFVTSSRTISKESGDILICGMVYRNRAVHGDEVVVEILPQNQWKSKSLRLKDDSNDANDNIKESTGCICDIIIPNGKIVGILERRWRNYVATLPEEDEDSTSVSKNKERMLVIPYDYRIPKIRILTKQAEKLRNQRILVRIDHWEKDSQYPNGHFVQALGEMGDVETEIKSLLIEHEISVGEFSHNMISELPVDTNENPWTLEAAEIKKRLDLRSSHLIFSIDPKGCEDVDDALSVMELPDGGLELGVHIADVTHFVQAQSFIDLEARCRSTSIYLPDRRYDMLPQVLSGNLCSLLGNVDRYAVSVLWKLDSNCKVLDVWFGRTIINSKYKLCYEHAQDILFGAPAEEMISQIPELQGLGDSDLNLRFEKLKNSLFKLYYIANTIRKDRLNTGGLELSSVNMKFEIDRNLPSAVTDVKSVKELAVHKTVAECMIFANHWVAKKISEAFPRQSVLRRHPNPRETNLLELQKLAYSKGFTLNIHTNKDLAESLDRAIDNKDPSVNQILRILATQTMNQATYFCTGYFNISEFYHYGLGLDKYTHFTSPIRRYADILVHRLLLAAVEIPQQDINIDTAEMEEICNHMNTKHKAAQEIEKDSQQLFLSIFFDDLATKNNGAMILADAVIYSLRVNGVLIFIPKYNIKGALHLCNKDGKVAIVQENIEWVEGRLMRHEDMSISVEAVGLLQKYCIFDHLTVSITVKKSRSHQNKMLFDLVKKEPYLSDWDKINENEPELLTSQVCIEENIDLEKNRVSEENKFNMYLFLEKIRAMTLISND